MELSDRGCSEFCYLGIQQLSRPLPNFLSHTIFSNSIVYHNLNRTSMKSKLNLRKIITTFVYCLTLGLRFLNLVEFMFPGVAEINSMIESPVILLAGYDNSHPQYTIPYQVQL